MANGIQFHFKRAERLFDKEQHKECIDTLSRIIDSDEATEKDKAEVYFRIGFTYNKQGRCENAIANYTKAIKLFTNNNDKAEVYSNRGTTYLAVEKYDKAINDYTEAIKLFTKNNKKAGAYVQRGSTYAIQSKYEDAIADYTKAIPLFTEDNNKAKAYFGKGLAYSKKSEYNNAIADFTKAIPLFTGSNDKANGYYYKGNGYSAQGEHENAIADYTQAIELYTKDNSKANAHYNRGIAYYAQGKYKDAINDYIKAIPLFDEDNNKANAYYNKGVAYKAKGENDKAIANYQKSIPLLSQHACNSYKEAKTFYKFCPVNKNTLAMLIQQQIYFSDIASLNDPLECPLVQEDEFLCNTVFAKGSDYEPHILSLVLPCNDKKEHNAQQSNTTLPVNNALLFFSHYAASHTGICIEYQIDKEFLQKHTKMFDTRVRYQETKRIESIEDLFAVKNKQWAYEDEARFVAFGKEKLYDATEETGVKITRIWFGINTSEEDKDLLYKIMKRRGVQFFAAHKTGTALLDVEFELYPEESNT